MISLDDIRGAQRRIGAEVAKTPVVPSASLTDFYGGITFKLETLQHTGSFKVRGALNRLRQLSDSQRRGGVLAFSAGNHAQGVAWAARQIGAAAKIVMPQPTPLVKVVRTEALGADVERYGHTFDEARSRAEQLHRDGRMTFVHPFDDPQIVAGQGTAGLEILEQVPDLEAVVCPIGGGGFISGVATAIKELRPQVKVYGVQAESAPAVQKSYTAKRLEVHETTPTLAEGIAIKTPAELTLAIMRRYVDHIALVTESEIESAVYALLADERILSEGAAAAVYAALAHHRFPELAGRRVVAVLTGANVDANVLHRIIDRSMVRQGRTARIWISVRDRPGALAGVLRVVGDAEANVLAVQHERSFSHSDLWQVDIEIAVETRSREHVEALLAALRSAGYESVRELGPQPLPL